MASSINLTVRKPFHDHRYNLFFSPNPVFELQPTVVISPMDWQGQKLAEHLMQLLLVCFAVAAFIAGYVLGSFQMMMMIYAAGVVLTSLITVPNWPFFNHHSLNWLDPSEAEKHPKPQPALSVPKKKTSKK